MKKETSRPPPFYLYLQASGCLTSHRREDHRTWSEYQTWSSHSTINPNGTLGKLLALLSLYSIPFKMDKDIATHPSSSWGFSDDWCRWKIKLWGIQRSSEKLTSHSHRSISHVPQPYRVDSKNLPVNRLREDMSLRGWSHVNYYIKPECSVTILH